MAKRGIAALECVGLFVAVPLALASSSERFPVLLALGMVALPVFVWLCRAAPREVRPDWKAAYPDLERQQIRRVLRRFVVSAVLMIALVAMAWPARLFSLPVHTPVLWLELVIFYPLLSVVPQELICRTYFFFRYRRLFPQRQTMVLGSALAFAAIHIVYHNTPALVLSAVAGLFFADTYARSQSFRLVWLEHSMYGIAVFTIGLGSFFERS